MSVGLTVDERLRPAWDATAPAGVALRGLAAAEADGRAACVVVTDRALDGATDAALAVAVGELLGVATVELAALDAAALPDLLRQWVNQAAQGAGRGVAVRVAGEGPVRVLVRSIDSSARELALRLASPYEPALPALRALLGTDVTVEDEES